MEEAHPDRPPRPISSRAAASENARRQKKIPCSPRLLLSQMISRPGSEPTDNGLTHKCRGTACRLRGSPFLIGADDKVAFSDLISRNSQSGLGV